MSKLLSSEHLDTTSTESNHVFRKLAESVPHVWPLERPTPHALHCMPVHVHMHMQGMFGVPNNQVCTQTSEFHASYFIESCHIRLEWCGAAWLLLLATAVRPYQPTANTNPSSRNTDSIAHVMYQSHLQASHKVLQTFLGKRHILQCCCRCHVHATRRGAYLLKLNAHWVTPLHWGHPLLPHYTELCTSLPLN